MSAHVIDLDPELPPPGPATWHNQFLALDNAFSRAVLTASDEQSEYPAANLATWLDVSKWKSTGAGTVTITAQLPVAEFFDSWALHSHNLHRVAGTITPQYSTDGVDWEDFDDVVAPAVSGPVYRVKSSTVLASWWRFEITTSAAAEIGILGAFHSVRLPRGPSDDSTDPRLTKEPVIENQISDSGGYLGRSVTRHTGRGRFGCDGVSADWVYEYWPGIEQHLQRHPFFYARDPFRWPGAVAFGIADQVAKPSDVGGLHYNLRVDYRAITE